MAAFDPHPEKTRPVEFGRNPAKNPKSQGKKPATFDFLRLTHIWRTQPRGDVHRACEDDRH